MALLILTRDYGTFGGRRSLAQVDIAPEHPFECVFSERTGFIEIDASRETAMKPSTAIIQNIQVS